MCQWCRIRITKSEKGGIYSRVALVFDMLNITPSRSAAAAKSYFAQSDYYTRVDEQEIVGEWGGKGATLLGLEGTVDQKSFHALCDNLHPQTGQPLTNRTYNNRRVGYDFTWSAPKSASVMHALTGDDEIVRAFRQSVKDTMTEMEADTQARVRKGNQDQDRTTGNLCWAEFVHLTSRPVNGVPCPQLHAHCFAFNATFDSVERQWKAGQFGKIKQDAYYWQAVQQVRFANELQELGYHVRKTKDAFEIVGVPDSVIEKFSLRSRFIDQVAAKLGITSAKSKAKLAATTREAKNHTVPYQELLNTWEAMLSKEEAGVLGIVAQEKEPHTPNWQDSTHVEFAIDHVFERASVSDERRLLTVALRHGLGDVTPEGVRSELASLKLLARDEGNQRWVTTEEVLAEESKMIRFAVAGKNSCKPLASAGSIELHDSRLNDGQRQAVEHLLTSSDHVMIIRGKAGTGKSTLMQEAVAQIEERGKAVVMLAPSAEASRGVLREAGFADADTLATFLLNEKMQERARDGFIVLDEAGLVGTPSLAGLFSVAARVDARVVLMGDKKQLGSVERGAALRVLEDIAGLPVAEVTQIQRQTNEDYKAAVKLMAAGRLAEGYDKLDAIGGVKTLPVWDNYDPVASDYADKLEHADPADKDRSVLIVCPTHAEGEKITQDVRRELKERGLLGNEEHECLRLKPLQWTNAEKADLQHYSGEEWLQFHRHSGVFKAGQRIQAREALAHLTRAQAPHFSVFASNTIDLSVGDVIRLNAGGKSLDGKHKLNNGAVYGIAGFSDGGDLVLSNGWTISKDFGSFAHGYVSTAHAAQGRTVHHVLLVASAMSHPAVSREGFYVAVSRGKQSVTVYTDDKLDLKEAVHRSDRRMSATELVSLAAPNLRQRMRQAVYKVQQATQLAVEHAARTIAHAIPDKEKTYAYER